MSWKRSECSVWGDDCINYKGSNTQVISRAQISGAVLYFNFYVYAVSRPPTSFVGFPLKLIPNLNVPLTSVATPWSKPLPSLPWDSIVPPVPLLPPCSSCCQLCARAPEQGIENVKEEPPLAQHSLVCVPHFALTTISTVWPGLMRCHLILYLAIAQPDFLPAFSLCALLTLCSITATCCSLNM